MVSYRHVFIAISLIFVTSGAASADDHAFGREMPRISRKAAQDPVVIAIVEPGGLNVLHSDFASGAYKPSTDVPESDAITLPTSGSFSERAEAVQSGPLGDMQPGKLYRIRDTRILGIYVSETSTTRNIFHNAAHGTGSVSSALGAAHGTYANAFVVYVPDTSAAAWKWLARQPWIDMISTSYAGVSGDDCQVADAIRRITAQGRIIFSAVGNGEGLGTAAIPSGLPEVYQVGGVDSEGKPYFDASNPQNRTPNRPYETGDRYLFEAADSNSLTGSAPFGGTSGAAPSTAGRAAEIVAEARALLDAPATSAKHLAIAGRGVVLPTVGPLSDGTFTSGELAQLLHDVARPSYAGVPSGFLLEGFGALDDSTTELAKSILAGRTPEPDREQDEEFHEATEDIRAMATARC